MLARLVLCILRLFPSLSYDYRHRRIRRRQFCPACGNKVWVTIRVDQATGQVTCQCPIDMAMWAFDPVVRLDKWARLPKVED
jgi:hypothetical protein